MADIAAQERESQLRKMERSQHAAAYVAKEAICIHCHTSIVQWRPRLGASYVHAESGMHSCPKEFQPLPNLATPIV